MIPGASATVTPQLRVEALRSDGAALDLKFETVEGGRRLNIPSGCQVTLFETYPLQRETSYATQTSLQIDLADHSQLIHYKVVQEGRLADHQSFLEIAVGASASFQSHVFLLGGAHIRNTLQVRLVGEDAECILNGLFIGRADQVMETHTLIDHVKPRGTSRELYKGILDGQAQGIFDGLIVVQKDAQKTDSAQTNRNLLLSPAARAKSNPELKIFANDVKCKHGSTIGQIHPEQLFYLRSRGIPEDWARRLLIYAFASEMVQGVQDAALRQELEKLIHV